MSIDRLHCPSSKKAGRTNTARQSRGCRFHAGHWSRQRSGWTDRTSGRTSEAMKPSDRSDVDHAPTGGKRSADLDNARVASARRGVDFLTQLDLSGEWHQAQRIVVAIHRLVGSPWRRRRRCGAWIKELERCSRPFDRRLADFVLHAQTLSSRRSPREAQTQSLSDNRRF